MHKIFIIFILFIFIPLSLFSKVLKPVTLQLSWFDQFQFAGYYMAKEKGYYEEYGLDVTIIPYDFGIDVSSEVDSEKVDFGVGRETLILERVSGKKIVALYSLFQESPLIMLSKKESNINKIQDFSGKRVMTTLDDAGEVSLKSMILSKGVKTEDLKIVEHSHNIMDLVNNKVDLISGYLSKSPYDLQKLGIEYNTFSPKDYGFDMYSDFLFTYEDKIKNDLDTVLAFKKASLKGWEYAYSNINETAKYIYDNLNTQKISLDALIFEGKVLKKLSYSNANKLGEIKLEKIQRIYDLYNVMGLTPNKIDFNKFVLNKNINDKIDFSNKEKNYIFEKKEITMCLVDTLKPYLFSNEGEFKGIVLDYMKLINKKIKTDYQFVKTKDINESIDFLKKGKCEIIPFLGKNEELKESILFTKPYMNVSFALATRNETNFIDDISLLKNKKVAILKNRPYSKLLKRHYPFLKFIDVENVDQGLIKVKNEDVFAFIGFLHPLMNKIEYDYLNKLKIAGKLDYILPVSIGVNKNDKMLFSILDKSVKTIPKENIDDILQKRILVEYKKEFDYETLGKFIFIFFIIIIAILYKQIMLKNMNKTLKDKVDEKTLELQIINNNLEERVELELSKNIRKDSLLRKQSKMAAMGEMIQNISHQWRQPLSIISTGASGLKVQKEINGSIDDKLLDETLTTIVSTAVSLSKTIDDFMYFFKPSKERTLFSVNNCVVKILNIFDYNRSEANIKIIDNIEDINIIAYESEFIQILMNVLNNSKEAFLTLKEKNKLIFIDIKKEQNNLIVEIKDNAGGISEDILPKIFEPYFTTKHQFQGKGIGLYMCQEILEKHMDGIMEINNTEFEYEGKNYKGTLTIIKLRID